MADNAVTVDELAIRVAANATAASASIDTLTKSLTRLSLALVTPLKQLQALAVATKGVDAKVIRLATPKVGGGGNGGGGDDGQAALQKAIDKTRATLDDTSATFHGVASTLGQGLTPATTALAQMNSLSGKFNTNLVKLKDIGAEAVPTSEFAALDAEFASMKRQTDQIKASLAGVPKMANVAAASFLKFKQTGGQLVNKGFTLGGSFAPTPFVSSKAADTAAAAATARQVAELATARQSIVDTLARISTAKQTMELPLPSLDAPVAQVGRFRSVVDSVSTRLTTFRQRLTEIGSRGSESVGFLAKSFIKLRSAVFFTLFTLGAVYGAFKLFIGQASSAVETANLFGVAFGEMTDEALTWAQTFANRLFLDPAGVMKTAATFNDMARSMGLSSRYALRLSENLTQLSYDYASLRDQPFEYVAKKFQSALAGQTRAIREYGLDVTIAAIQDEIYAEGLNYKVKELNRASKAVLIHNLLVRNSTRAQGDLARTLSSPANMMRVLGDTVKMAARAIGFLFLPFVKMILPWLIALAQGALMAAQALGAVFGIKIPSWNTLVADIGGVAAGTEDASEGMDGVANGAERAAAAAKKLKDYTLGIDELNILSPETADGGSGGGGAGGGGVGGVAPGIVPLPQIAMPNVSHILDGVKKALGNLKIVFAPFLKAIGQVWKALQPFARNVWKGFTDFYKHVLIPLAVWTMNTAGVWVLERVRDILEWFNAHPGAAKAVGAAIAAFTALKGLDIVINIVSKLGGLLAGIFSIKFLGPLTSAFGAFLEMIGGSTFVGSIGAFFSLIGEGGGVFATLSAALGISVGWIAAIIAAVVAAAVLIVLNWDKIKAAAGVLWGAIKSLWTSIVAAWQGIMDRTRGVWTWIGGFFKTIWGVIRVAIMVPLALLGTAIITTWNNIKSWTKTAWDAVYNRVKGPLGELWKYVKPILGTIGRAFSDTWAGLSAGLSGVWSSISGIFKSGANGLIRIINNGPIRLINSVLAAAKKIDKTGLLKGVAPVARIPYLATGGMPTTGQLFVAGEQGIEIAGSFGGNPNTVMPLENSGFVEAMYAATFRAVANAMSQADGSGDGSGDVYLDGEKVGAVLRKGERRRGVGYSLVTAG